MNHIQESILSMDYHLSSSFNKLSHFASQETQLRILREHYDINICRRTLCRHRAILRAMPAIKSIKRHVKGEDGKPKFRSSVTVVLKKGYYILKAYAKRLAPVIKRLLTGIETSLQKTRTFTTALNPESPHPSREEVAFKWKEMRLSLFPDQLTTSP